MAIKRHIPFLREVFIYALSAFGGPSAHIGIIQKLFVEKRKDITQQELMEYFSFCQMLPGPSSTQTITLIAFKRGGAALAILALIIWVLPAATMMGALSFLVKYFSISNTYTSLFKFIAPMAIGFLVYASYKAMRVSVSNMATYSIMAMAIVFSLLFRSPWVFPILLVIGGVVSNFSNKRIPDMEVLDKKIKWRNLIYFFLFFALAGVISEIARVHKWPFAPLINLFENFYRFGSIVFGGGHVLMPAMYDQFVALPTQRSIAPLIDTKSFLIGCGMVNCVPGPVFSICAYVGGLAMSNFGIGYQFAGIIIATLGIFLPSLFLLLFLFPIYQKLKKIAPIYRALEGINAVVIGVMWAGAFILLRSLNIDIFNIGVLFATFLLLQFTKIPPPFIVLLSLMLGYFF